MSFSNVLIANRGEIAVRVARSVAAEGLQSIAVFSDVDRHGLHVSVADRSVALGGSSATESYLDIDKLIDAARRSGAQAIHPGYGFLSENADFARACASVGVVFIGPSPEALELMGNKRAAKIAALEAGVPCIPGYQGQQQSDADLLSAAEGIGFPLMVKAAAGGGGRGMRRVEALSDLPAAIGSARAEARSAFGNDELILEKVIGDGRHIEVQVAADAQGNVVHLGERDCSLQRRHQKVIEEAPSPFVDEDLRRAMGEAAVALARSCGYLGVGTVEFLVDAGGEFSFLEMNTRLQVEHPVTELVTGIDLVAWQLRIAAGVPLPVAQSGIGLRGHAMEARLYAEDPASGFMPQTGEILVWRPASGPGVRNDHGVLEGDRISPFYDPMIAKVIAHGETREQARRRLIRALDGTALLGVGTNQRFLRRLLADPTFAAGCATTNYIDEVMPRDLLQPAAVGSPEIALAAAMLLRLIDPQPAQWQHWSNTAGMIRRRLLRVGDARHAVALEPEPGGYRVEVAGAEHRIGALKLCDGVVEYDIDGVGGRTRYAFHEGELFVQLDAGQLKAADVTYEPVSGGSTTGTGRVVAVTDGQVTGVAVTTGARVTKGQTLVVVEAMKMEHRHTADGDGVVAAVHAQVDAQVKKGQLLVLLELEVEAP